MLQASFFFLLWRTSIESRLVESAYSLETPNSKIANYTTIILQGGSVEIQKSSINCTAVKSTNLVFSRNRIDRRIHTIALMGGKWYRHRPWYRRRALRREIPAAIAFGRARWSVARIIGEGTPRPGGYINLLLLLFVMCVTRETYNTRRMTHAFSSDRFLSRSCPGGSRGWARIRGRGSKNRSPAVIRHPHFYRRSFSFLHSRYII